MERKQRIRKSKKEPVKEKKRGPVYPVTPWGRAASEHRPGIFIYNYLSEHGEASVSDIYKGLSEFIDDLNLGRDKPIRRPNYSSFARYFHWFKILGLVERTGRTASVRAKGLEDILQPLVFYKLTPTGQAEVIAWADPIAKAHPEFR